MAITPWGAQDRYYSEPEQWNPRKKPKADLWDEEAPKHWENLLKAIDPNAEEKVTRTFRTWNLIIRDQLRNETGFRLTHGDQQVNVPVRIESGIPAPLIEPLWSAQKVGFLLLHRNLISKSKQGVEFIGKEFLKVTDFLLNLRSKEEPEATWSEVNRVHGLLMALDGELNKVDLLKNILRIEQDILGAYFFRKPQIRIYWLAIGIVALMLDVEIEALTVAVLAHELAHAYTHLGRDIDGRQWETETFAQSDIHIVEGLAQYYTQSVCTKLAGRYPLALGAFNRLLEEQSAPYRCFGGWIEGKNDPGEFVRHCLIQTRAQSLIDYDAFPGAPGQQASAKGNQSK